VHKEVVEGGNRLYRLLLFLCLALCLLTTSSVLPSHKPSSVCAADYYQLKPNSYYVSLGVKGYQQTTEYTCGPAAVMSLMHWYKLLDNKEMNHETEMKIAKEMGTRDMNPSHLGTTPQQMVQWLERNGFQVTWGENGSLEMLRENLKKGIPTIVEWIDWGGHWVVVTGYHAGSESPAKGTDTIFFADPAIHWSSTNNPDGISSFNAWRFHDMWFDAQYFKPGQLVKRIYITAFPIKEGK